MKRMFAVLSVAVVLAVSAFAAPISQISAKKACCTSCCTDKCGDCCQGCKDCCPGS